ncbi:3377_t:CDS:2 [Paraglomus brasilianum]|uniref:3377_t:CDS:1 n=1 Tax=Paraglomus brasilianum TaxID=144538 RepID=A0A9N9D206_9GLOM|nr:3377_t:CDS:2 [Paraglomus brasilianum]
MSKQLDSTINQRAIFGGSDKIVHVWIEQYDEPLKGIDLNIDETLVASASDIDRIF